MVSSVTGDAMFMHFCSGDRGWTLRLRRTYCETDIDPAHRKLSQLEAVVRYLTGKEPDMECKRKRNHLCIIPRWPYNAVDLVRPCPPFLNRRWSVAAANSFWRRGHSSYGGLLDRSHAQLIEVSVSTQHMYICYAVSTTWLYLFPLLLWQHGRRGGNGLPGDPFRPDESPEIHGHWEKDCKVSGNDVCLSMLHRNHHVHSKSAGKPSVCRLETTITGVCGESAL